MSDKEFELNQEIADAIDNGPTFGQSTFQNQTFVVGAQASPGRAYRQVLLQLREKYNALKLARIRRKKANAEISLLMKKKSHTTDIDEQTIIECDIEEKNLALDNENKLIKDAMAECSDLYLIFKSIPTVTKEEFDREEKKHWADKLIMDAHMSVLANGRIDSGTALALHQIGINPVAVQIEAKIAQEDQAQAVLEHRKQYEEEQKKLGDKT